MNLNRGAIVGLVGVMLIVGVIMVSQSMRTGWWNGGDDYRLLIVSPKNIYLMVVSPKRGLVNQIEVGEKSEVWIPKGLGWYGTDKIYKLMTQEKRRDQMNEVAFYNFGFWPDKVWWTDNGNSLNDWQMWLNCGWLNGIRLKIMADRMLVREGNWVSASRGQQLLIRDMADSMWLENETRFNVVNNSKYNGLAEWVGDRLTWSGLTVASVESGESDQSGCQLLTGSQKENQARDNLIKQLSQRLGNCEIINDDLQTGNEVELRVGEKWAKMLQYFTYVRSF